MTKVCPLCGSNRVQEVMYAAVIIRELYILDEDEWEIDDEEIEYDYDTVCTYTCKQCDYMYKNTFIGDVIEKEMILETEKKEK
jgi:hypothetical protein